MFLNDSRRDKLEIVGKKDFDDYYSIDDFVTQKKTSI